jgi:sugar phosphate isomerase/epimerase
MTRLGIEFISALGMPPIGFVEITAAMGCNGLGMALAPFTANPHGYPDWSLREDAGLRRDLVTALADNDVKISIGEGFLIRPASDVADYAADLDLFAQLGATRVNILTIDSDVTRSTAELARFADMAAQRGLDVTLEYMAGMAVGDLAAAADLVRSIARSNVTLMIDGMHLARSNGVPADVAALDPALIGYLQLCDVADKPLDTGYGEEARHNRMGLGSGDLPIADLVAACPSVIRVGLETPMLSRAQAGEGPKQRLAASVAFAKQLLGEA